MVIRAEPPVMIDEADLAALARDNQTEELSLLGAVPAGKRWRLPAHVSPNGSQS